MFFSRLADVKAQPIKPIKNESAQLTELKKIASSMINFEFEGIYQDRVDGFIVPKRKIIHFPGQIDIELCDSVEAFLEIFTLPLKFWLDKNKKQPTAQHYIAMLEQGETVEKVMSQLKAEIPEPIQQFFKSWHQLDSDDAELGKLIYLFISRLHEVITYIYLNKEPELTEKILDQFFLLGADPDFQVEDGKSTQPFVHAVMQNGSLPQLRAFVRAGCHVTDFHQLTSACLVRGAACAELLLDFMDTSKQQFGELLTQLAQEGRTDVVAVLLRKKDITPAQLQLPIRFCERPETLTLLLNATTDTAMKLQEAVYSITFRFQIKNAKEIALTYSKHLGRETLLAARKEGLSLFGYAMQNDNDLLMMNLLTTQLVDLQADKEAIHQMMFRILKRCRFIQFDEELLQTLIDVGKADVNCVDKDTKQPFMIALFQFATAAPYKFKDNILGFINRLFAKQDINVNVNDVQSGRSLLWLVLQEYDEKVHLYGFGKIIFDKTSVTERENVFKTGRFSMRLLVLLYGEKQCVEYLDKFKMDYLSKTTEYEMFIVLANIKLPSVTPIFQALRLKNLEMTKYILSQMSEDVIPMDAQGKTAYEIALQVFPQQREVLERLQPATACRCVML